MTQIEELAKNIVELSEPELMLRLGLNSQEFNSDLTQSASIDSIDLRSATPPVFPIKGSRHDDVAGGHMQTDFTLDAGGTLNGVTRWWTNVKLTGLTGSVTVVLTDIDKRPLWATVPRTHAVDGEWIGDDDRHENWNETVPSGIIDQVRGYAILQQHNPKWLSLVGERSVSTLIQTINEEAFLFGESLFKRLNTNSYDLLCKNSFDDETLKNLKKALDENIGLAAGMLAPILVANLGLAPAIAAIMAALIVKTLSKSVGETICEAWAKALKDQQNQASDLPT